MFKRRQFFTATLQLTAANAWAVPIDMGGNEAKDSIGRTLNEPEETDPQKQAILHRFQATFRSFLDTLFPADEVSKSASTLGIDSEILELANHNERYRLLLRQGCEWLNAAAKYEGNRTGSFATLAEDARIRIIEIAENTGDGQAGPARFVNTVLAHANQIYYAKPEVWQTLGYSGPPQPNGFSDFTKPFGQAKTL